MTEAVARTDDADYVSLAVHAVFGDSDSLSLEQQHLANIFRHEGVPIVEFGSGTQSAHGIDNLVHLIRHDYLLLAHLPDGYKILMC